MVGRCRNHHETREFKWMNEEELEDWRSFSCILEVDLEYILTGFTIFIMFHFVLLLFLLPFVVNKNVHNGYPLAPERVTVNKVNKLIPNLRNKKKYVVHYENLKLYERLGLKITKKFTEVLSLKKAPG